MAFAVRSQMHLPPAAIAFPSLDTLRPSVLTAGTFGQQEPSRPLQQQQQQQQLLLPPPPPPASSAYGSYAPRTRLPIAHVTDGLRTPPPEMPSTSTYATAAHPHAQYGPLKQIEPPIAGSHGVPNMLNTFREPVYNHPIPATAQTTRSQSPKQILNPIESSRTQQENHIARAQAQPTRRQSTSSRSGSSTALVPASINNTKGSLGDFAAQITCLFWFESTFVLHRVAESSNSHPLSPIQALDQNAIPSSGFRKWVTTILATTQVSENVILLALLFVYRLKKLNPSVQGKPGSEFRLFTVALMLGNKFLDDNTYTNKTWAEVSGINVQEIHIMEVEFLSNMRYSLYVSEQEWKEWHQKLGQFWAFWDRASRMATEIVVRAPKANMQTLPSMPAELPSPPPSNNSSPPYYHSRSPISNSGNAFSHPHHLPTPVALNPPHHPYTPMPQPDFDPLSRKRSMDYTSVMQPPAKRVTRSSAPKLSVNVPQFPVHIPSNSTNNPQLPRLQQLEYSTAPPMQLSAPGSACSMNHDGGRRPMLNLPTQQQMQAQLPLPGTRSLSMIYPQPSTSAPCGPQIHNNINLSPYNPRQSSPYSHHHSAAHSAASSPTTPGYGPQRSPTWILGNRDSPYRPVHTVNRLLIPPPSQAPQPHHVGYDQMHYQPLTKSRSEYRTGVVPYMQPEVSWSQQWPEQHYP